MSQAMAVSSTQPERDRSEWIVLSHVHDKPEMFRPDFRAWLIDNYHIWHAFRRHANAIWATGREHYSARTIIEVIRHETAIREKDSAWKLNNNWAPDLARLYGRVYPDRSEFFERRVQLKSVRLV